MHTSAIVRMKWFVNNYIPKNKPAKVLDVGSYNVNGCYKQLFSTTQVEYIGLDVASGPNVDLVPKEVYNWTELVDESFDFVISGNAFEHIEYPWLTIKEIYRVLKDGGFACILAPFSHEEHRYPVDCYRYYSDGFRALAKWADFKVVEVTVGGVPKGSENDPQWISGTNYDDTMMVLLKDLQNRADLNGLPKLGSEKRVRKWA